MQSGLIVSRRREAPRTEDVVYCGEGCTIKRLSRDRYHFQDALMVAIKTGAELDKLLKDKAEEHFRTMRQMSAARRVLEEARSGQDGAPPTTLVRRVDVAPTLRSVPSPTEAKEAPPAAAPKRSIEGRTFRAPPKRTRKPKTPEACETPSTPEAEMLEGADLTGVPQKVDAPAPRKRRSGGLSYLKQLQAAAAEPEPMVAAQ